MAVPESKNLQSPCGLQASKVALAPVATTSSAVSGQKVQKSLLSFFTSPSISKTDADKNFKVPALGSPIATKAMPPGARGLSGASSEIVVRVNEKEMLCVRGETHSDDGGSDELSRTLKRVKTIDNSHISDLHFTLF
jgi:hypothetical protein